MSTSFDSSLVVVFFFYGLAFFSMGLAIWLEVGRAPEDRSAKAFLFLAAFGVLHGFHEWFEIYILLRWGDVVSSSIILPLEVLRVSILVLSFLLLFIFGLRLIHANRDSRDSDRRSAVLWTIGLTLLWLFTVIAVFVSSQPCDIDCVEAADVLSRYLLAIPASLLSAWAMLTQRKTYLEKGMPSCARDITWAAVALLLYGFAGQLFTRETFLFPSNVVNAELFQQFAGIPVQLFRGILAASLALFIIRAMRSFEFDRRHSLTTANNERLAAQRESLEVQKQARAETEQLNRELTAVVQDLTMLFELSRSLASTLDPEVMLRQAMSRIYETIPRVSGGMILLRDREERLLKQMAQVGYDDSGASVASSDVTDRQAFEVGEAVVFSGQSYCWTGRDLIPAMQCSCMTGVPDPDDSALDTGKRTMGMPLVIREQVAGSLVISMDGNSNWLTQRDLSLIRTVASQLSLAVANATLYKEVQARDELRGELLHQIVSAQELERQGFARDLHDGAGQMATALGIGLAAAHASVKRDPEQAEKQLLELKKISNQLVHELQGLIKGLRPSVLDDLGLVPALAGLAKGFEDWTGVKTEFALSGSTRRLVPDLETIVFRIAQEGLTNVNRHARANSVRILVDYTEGAIGLRIQDDGRGFNPQEIFGSGVKKQWGLIGIRERVALVGGSCDIVSWPGDGTTIQVRIPLNEEIIHV